MAAAPGGLPERRKVPQADVVLNGWWGEAEPEERGEPHVLGLTAWRARRKFWRVVSFTFMFEA